MKHKALITGAVMAIGLSFAFEGALAGPASFGGSARAPAALALSADTAAAKVEKTQFRRRAGARARVGVAPRGFRSGRRRRGLSSGAAIGLGVGAAALGILGAAAAANAHPAPGPVYEVDDCYWVRRPMYDDWGNYIGRQKVRVCD